MLKYYSYYNVGGYKDMYLGDSSITDNKSYFFPLLPIWKKNALAGDESFASRVESLEILPMIQIITNDNSYGLPHSAKLLFSHGGYKLVLATADTGELIFSIRDVEGVTKDDSGRKIPFLLIIVGSSESDKKLLETVAAYAASHLETFSKKISILFDYDSEKNGISFDLATLTAYLNKISKESNNSLLTLHGEIVIGRKNAQIPLLVLPEGIEKQIAIKEQGLSGKQVNFVDLLDIIPLDNHDKLVAIIKRLKRNRSTPFSDWKVLCLLGGVALLGFVVGYIIAK